MNLEKLRLFTYQYPFIRMIFYPLILVRRFFLRKKLSNREEVYNNLCEILAEDPVIKVNEFQGVFYIDCRSDLFKRILFSKTYEIELVKLCLRYLNKKKDAIDVGANIGFYSVLFAKNLEEKKVLAIEPTQNSLNRLYKNIELNNVKNKVLVFNGAVANFSGNTEIKIIEGREEYSSIAAFKHPCVVNENFKSEIILVDTLDNLVTKYSLNPGFIKIDVEGSEHLVFLGAKKVLEVHRPIILSELSNLLLKANGSSSEEVVRFIKSYNYEVKDAYFPNVSPVKREFTEIICIPKEMIDGHH